MGVPTEVRVANLALTAVGELQMLDSFEEDTTPARLCKEVFSTLRDEVLEEHDWTFARRHAVLAVTTQTRTNWTYVYSAPADCLAPRYIDPGVRPISAALRIPFDFELSDDATSMVICTNQQSAELVYTGRPANPVVWSGKFVTALSARLAIQLAGALHKSPQLAMQLTQAYGIALAVARASDKNRGQENEEPESEAITVRG